MSGCKRWLPGSLPLSYITPVASSSMLVLSAKPYIKEHEKQMRPMVQGPALRLNRTVQTWSNHVSSAGLSFFTCNARSCYGLKDKAAFFFIDLISGTPRKEHLGFQTLPQIRMTILPLCLQEVTIHGRSGHWQWTGFEGAMPCSCPRKMQRMHMVPNPQE